MGCFGLSLRLAALVALMVCAAGLYRTPHRRVVVLAAPGMEFSVVQELAAGSRLPTLAALLERAVVGPVQAAGEVQVNDLYRALLGRLVFSRPGANSLRWEVLAPGLSLHKAVVAGVPGVVEGGGGPLVVFPGPHPAQGFVGDSVGVRVTMREASAGKLPWPHQPAAEAAAEAVEELQVGSWTQWIPVPGDDDAEKPDAALGWFKVYRQSRTSLYLTPVHRVVAISAGVDRDPSGDTIPYMTESWAVAMEDEELRAALYAEAEREAELRWRAVERLVATDWEVFVLHDPVVAQANERSSLIESEDVDVEEVRARAYELLDSRLAVLMGADAATVVLLVGQAQQGSSADSPGGEYAVAGTWGKRVAWPIVSSDLPAILYHLAGVRGERTGGKIPAPVQAQYSALAVRGAQAASSQGKTLPLSPEQLDAFDLFDAPEKATEEGDGPV